MSEKNWVVLEERWETRGNFQQKHRLKTLPPVFFGDEGGADAYAIAMRNQTQYGEGNIEVIPFSEYARRRICYGVPVRIPTIGGGKVYEC